MGECIAVNIQDMLKAIGEEKLQRLLSDFSSPLNEEVEDFVRDKSIEFARKKLSVTYLVIRRTDSGEAVLVGIFTLAHKAVEVTNTNISNTARRKLERYARLDKETDKYNVSAFLIAQFGKNSAVPGEWKIAGNELMDLTFEILKHVQYYVGGGLVSLRRFSESLGCILLTQNRVWRRNMDFQAFKTNIKILDREAGSEIRERYIENFINTSSPRYYEMIEQRHKFQDGYCYLGYLWDHLKNPIVITREYVEVIAKDIGEVYVFWDIQTCERIFIKNYWKLGKDTVIKLKFEVLLENYRYLPEDIYIFDETFQWTLIFTHEEVDGVPYCVKSGDI